MTKELENLFSKASQAISSLGRCNGGNNETIARGCLRDIQRALENYVVIPKGKNRHPYADVLHEKLENMDLRLESTRFSAGFTKDDCIVVEGKGVYILEYRIKPEPVYEWQWEFTYNGLICRTGFYTYEQIRAYMYNIKVTKIEETKREQK